MDLKRITNSQSSTEQINNNQNAKETQKKVEEIQKNNQKQDDQQYLKILNENGVANNVNKEI